MKNIQFKHSVNRKLNKICKKNNLRSIISNKMVLKVRKYKYKYNIKNKIDLMKENCWKPTEIEVNKLREATVDKENVEKLNSISIITLVKKD